MGDRIPDFIESWINRAIKFDTSIRVTYISVVTFLSILIWFVIRSFSDDEYLIFIPYSFFFLMFFLWSYRISFANIVSDVPKPITRKDLTIVFFSTFISLTLQNQIFANEEFGFDLAIISIVGFSLISIVLSVLLKLLAIQNSLIYKYFICIFIASVVSLLVGLIIKLN